ncbi:MAG: hypothetical protein JWR34_7420 [Mycobacterium sp.]|nr:hypothetical protein [Mycobacterium sp.]
MTRYKNESGVLTEEEMQNQWSEDTASMDQVKVDQEEQHSYRWWLGDMLIFGRFFRDRRGLRQDPSPLCPRH